MEPAVDPKGSIEKALANAIRSSSAPLLNQAYLAKHSITEASAHGADVPVR
jgi:hypothetical protein